MNRYSLTSESRTWWLPSATAGSLAVAAIAAIAAVPVASAFSVESTGGQAPQAYVSVVDPGQGTRPCFMIRPHWNRALDGRQPRCGFTTTAVDPGSDPGAESGGVVRPPLPRTTIESKPGRAIRPYMDFLY